jgi:hypothetical protein
MRTYVSRKAGPTVIAFTPEVSDHVSVDVEAQDVLNKTNGTATWHSVLRVSPTRARLSGCVGVRVRECVTECERVCERVSVRVCECESVCERVCVCV